MMKFKLPKFGRSLLRSRRLNHQDTTIEQLIELYLAQGQPIMVFDPVDEKIIQQVIDRLFARPKAIHALTREIEFALARVHTPQQHAGMLTPDHKHAIVLTDYEESPYLVLLLGVIREFAFRKIGGGTADIDLDQLDYSCLMRQLIVIDLDAYERRDLIRIIYGSYRYKICTNRKEYEEGSVGQYFEFKDAFVQEHRGELGRSLINPLYLGKSFDPVLFGLAYLKVIHPSLVGFFGKITLYKQYELLGADTYFLGVAKRFWAGREREVVRVKPDLIALHVAEADLPTEDLHSLQKSLMRGLHFNLGRRFRLPLPPVLAIYDRITGLNNLSYFGAFRHKEFGDSTEVGMAIHFEDLKPSILDQYILPTQAIVHGGE